MSDPTRGGYVPTPFRTAPPADTGRRAGGYVPTPFRSESTAVASPEDQASARDRSLSSIRVQDLLRLGAAGVVPGWSDEIIAKLRSMDPNLTYEQAVQQEREGLKGIRANHPALSTFVELAAGVGTGLASGMALKSLGYAAKGASTVGQAAALGAKGGAVGGALAGSGNAEEGSRLYGGALGAATGAVVGGATGAGVQAVVNKFFPARPDPILAGNVFDESVSPAHQQAATAAVAQRFRQSGIDPADVRRTVEGGDLEPELPLWTADVGGDRTRQQLAKAEQYGNRAGPQIRPAVRSRDQGRVARRDDILGRASGVEPEDFPGYVQKIVDERKTVMDDLYESARRMAGERSRVPLPLETRRMLETPAVRQAYREVLAEDLDAVPAGVFAKQAGKLYAPVPPGVRTAPPPLEWIDANTLSRVAQKLKGTAESMRPTALLPDGKSKLATIASLDKFSDAIEEALEAAHPSFRQAREAGAFYAARMRAAEEGYKLATGSTSVGKVRAAMQKFDRPYMSIDGVTPRGNPLDDFRVGFRSRESEVLTGRAPAIGGAAVNPRPLREEVRQAVYGEPASLMLRKGDELEETMALTERATRGLRNAMTSGTPEASAALDDLGHATIGAGRDASVMGPEQGPVAAAWRFVQPAINALKRPNPQKMDAAADLLMAGRRDPMQLADALRMLEEENRRAMRPGAIARPVGLGYGFGSQAAGGLLGPSR